MSVCKLIYHIYNNTSMLELHWTTAIVQEQLKLYRQLKVLKRTLKTAINENMAPNNVFIKNIVSKYASE